MDPQESYGSRVGFTFTFTFKGRVDGKSVQINCVVRRSFESAWAGVVQGKTRQGIPCPLGETETSLVTMTQ